MRFKSETMKCASLTPRPLASDSDIVVLALVTAQALEALGEVAEAAQWIRRGADQAKREGRSQRVMELTHVAAKLGRPIEAKRSPASTHAHPEAPARMNAARAHSLRSSPARISSLRATIPRFPSSPAIRPANPESRLAPRKSKQAPPASTLEAMLALLGVAG